MSKFCVGAIKIKNYFHASFLKAHIKILLSKYGYGVFYDVSNCEPFMEKYLNNEYGFVLNNHVSFDHDELKHKNFLRPQTLLRDVHVVLP